MKQSNLNIIIALAFIFGIGSSASLIWAIVNFCLYLFKDFAFDWMPIYLLVFCVVMTVSLQLYAIFKS